MKKNQTLIKSILVLMRLSVLQLLATILFCGAAVASSSESRGQSILEEIITLKADNEEILEVLSQIERTVNVKFTYNPRSISIHKRVTFDYRDKSLGHLLENIFSPMGVTFHVSGNYVVLKRKATETGMSDPRPEFYAAFAVSGTVKDDKGDPLPGVNILVKQTTIGTTTDADGNYSLNVADGTETLVFSFIGYMAQEVAIQNRSVIHVTMMPDVKSLDEVVVIGYGIQKKANLTGAVVTVGEEELAMSPDANIGSRLQGRVPGVTVSRDNSPGGEVSIRVRGFGSINSNEPLIIIDGVPTTGGLSKINANDIESMTILKDAAASAIYGSRAANGVIIITTKRGKEGKSRVSFSSRYGVQRATNQLDLLNAREYAELEWLEFRNMGLSVGDPGFGSQQYGNGAEPVLPDYIYPAGKMEGEVDESTYSHPDPYNGITRANKEGTNWYDVIFGPAPIQEHNLSISGGTEKSNYAFSLGYMDQDGILAYTGFKRYSARANGDFEVTDWLTIGQTIGIANTNRTGASYNSEGGPVAQAYRAQSIIPVYDIRGNFAGTKSPTTGNASNPMAELYRNKDNFDNETRILANVYAQVDLAKNLSVKSLLGVDYNRNREKQFVLRNVEMSEARAVDLLHERYYGSFQYNWSNTINYQLNVNDDHHINLLAGTEVVNFNSDWFNGSRSTYAFTDIDYMVLDAGEDGQASGGSFDRWALFSYFGRMNYAYKGKYLLEGVFRRDASSRFSKDNRWGTFPALSAGWLISDEAFMNARWIDELKIRGGWGQNGNDNVGNYNIYSTYRSSGRASFYNIAGTSSTSSQAGYYRYKLGNADARWESTTTTNLGLDARLFNNRLEISLDVFRRMTKDMLYPDSRPSTWGRVELPSINVGEMKNSGWDLMLGYSGDLKQDFTYNVQANLSHYSNEVISLNRDANEILYGSTIRNAVFTATMAGLPVSSFYGYDVVGIFNTDAEVEAWPKYSPDINGDDAYSMPGVLKFRDVDGDGKITPEDRTSVGSPHPTLSYGLNLNLGYKNFDLTMFFQGVTGNSIVNYAKRVTDFKHFSNNRSKERLYESWTPERYAAGAPISLPIALSGQQDVVMQQPSSFFVEDGSYFRMKDLQLGYTLPVNATSKFKLERLRVYVQATNLFTITKYSGLDPEIRQTSDRQLGVDVGIYPTAQMFMFGVNLDL